MFFLIKLVKTIIARTIQKYLKIPLIKLKVNNLFKLIIKTYIPEG